MTATVAPSIESFPYVWRMAVLTRAAAAVQGSDVLPGAGNRPVIGSMRNDCG
jgi:hypothetical protein